MEGKKLFAKCGYCKHEFSIVLSDETYEKALKIGGCVVNCDKCEKGVIVEVPQRRELREGR